MWLSLLMLRMRVTEGYLSPANCVTVDLCSASSDETDFMKTEMSSLLSWLLFLISLLTILISQSETAL